MSPKSTSSKSKWARLAMMASLTVSAAVLVTRCGIDPTANKTFSTPQGAEDGSLPQGGQQYSNHGSLITLDPNVAQSRGLISDQQVEERIAADLQALGRNDAVFARYFTLTNLYNAGASAQDMATFGKGISKFMNSLSYQSTIVVPQPIDAEKTIYRVDLRAYGWRRFFWDEIQRRNPYAVFTGSRAEQFARQAAQSNFPVHVRADWFAFQGMQNPLYGIIMFQPNTLRALEFNILGINADANVVRGNVIRAGLSDSGVSQQNRIVEKQRTRFGSYWKSYDFVASGRRARRNIFEFATDNFFFGRGFEIAGGEMIYQLPNGLNAYYVADAQGRRLNAVPQNIAIDHLTFRDYAVNNAISCFGCHDAGFKNATDNIRGHFEKNAFAFSRAEVDVVRRLFPEQSVIDKEYADDKARFAQAIDQCQCKQVGPAEPVTHLAKRFDEDMPTHLVAAELGVTPADLQNGLARSRFLTRRVGQTLIGATVNRQTFEDNFPFLVELFGKGRSLFNRGVFGLKDGEGGAMDDDPRTVPELDPGMSADELLRKNVPAGIDEVPTPLDMQTIETVE